LNEFLVPWLLIVVAGCGLQRSDATSVALSTARLSVHHAAILTALVNDDVRCGFSSPRVLRNAKLQRTTASRGTVTLTVESCEIDLGPSTEVARDCLGVRAEASGRFRVTARRITEGALTGRADNPVVPDRSDAVRLELSVEPMDFAVKLSTSDTVLLQKSGRFSFVAVPRLGVSKSTGECSVPTGDLTLSELRYERASARVDSEGRHYDVDLGEAHLSAQIGRRGALENFLGGDLTLWGTKVVLPKGGGGGFDPKYNAETFARRYACIPDLALPVTDVCPARPRVREGAVD
jgi:hypothetical protein